MSFLARIWFFLTIAGIGGVAAGGWAIWNRISEPEPTTLTWAQFVAKDQGKNWLRIEDAPIVDVRTVRLVKQQKLRTVESAYVPAVVDPAAPEGPVRVFVQHTDAGDGDVPAVPTGSLPTVRRGLIEGRRINVSGDTREFLNRQGAPVAADMICLMAGPPPSISYGAAVIGCGVLLLLLGLKGRSFRKRKGAAPPAAD